MLPQFASKDVRHIFKRGSLVRGRHEKPDLRISVEIDEDEGRQRAGKWISGSDREIKRKHGTV